LICSGIRYLSIRSLILTIEVSIKIVTINAIIRIRNFRLLNDFLGSLNKLDGIRRKHTAKHNLFVAELLKRDYILNSLTCWFVIIFFPLVLILGVLSPVFAIESVNIFPPDSKPYGLTFAEHQQNFWKWILSIPAKESPVNDRTGEKCTNGQSNSNSSIFYLSMNTGGISERTCIVSAGKGLFIPVMQVEWSEKEAPGASVEELHKSAKKDQDSVNSLYLKINDKEYKYEDLIKYRTHTDVFEVVFPDNGIFGVIEGGVSKAVGDGFYIITEPLTKGNYSLHVKSSLICLDPGCAEPNFAQDIKYNIIAE